MISDKWSVFWEKSDYMKKYFYSETVDFSWVLAELGNLDITEGEKKELVDIAHAHLHQIIQDAILSELSERDKKIFLANLEYENHERTWKHLNEKVEKVEEKIMKAAEDLKRNLRSDLAGAKTGK